MYYPMDVDDVPAASDSRPDRLHDVSGPQERVQRHTVELIVDYVPVVPLLDARVPQPVEQLVDVLRFVDALVPVGLRGSTGGGAAPPTPSGPPHRGTPPGQGGIQILARGSGRPFDHAARVPAVQVVRVLLRDSVPSTECWTFQLCHRREIPQCSP